MKVCAKRGGYLIMLFCVSNIHEIKLEIEKWTGNYSYSLQSNKKMLRYKPKLYTFQSFDRR